MCVASEPNTGSPADALMVFVGRGPIQTGNTDFADAIHTAKAMPQFIYIFFNYFHPDS